MHSEKERAARRKYQKTHPEQHRKHSRAYRAKHKTEIAEYNRLNPEIRMRMKSEEMASLRQIAEQEGESPQNFVRRVLSDILKTPSEK